MISINPKRLSGPWKKGFSLDIHTISSTYLGVDSYGHDKFENKRSQIGELLYRLKYSSDQTVVDTIVKTANDFITGESWAYDLIVATPPNKARKYQPLIDIAGKLSVVSGKPFCNSCVAKTKSIPELKSVYDHAERLKLLKGAFSVDKTVLNDKTVLLIDDLYRSGATTEAVTNEILANGGAKEVFLLTITKTKNK